MSRFLFVVPPFTGHINPTVAVGQALMDRGHQVAWVGHPRFVAPLLPPGATILAVCGSVGSIDVQGLVAAYLDRDPKLRGTAALKFQWQDSLIPLAEAMAPEVDAAVDEFRPDVLIADQQALAGALVGRRRGMRWATSASTSAELAGPVDQLPRVTAWISSLLDQLQHRYGVAEVDRARSDLRFSEHLVIIYTVRELLGECNGVPSFPPHYAFVGPAVGPRPTVPHFPWDWLDRRHAWVLVSLGTLSRAAGQRFLGTMARTAEQLAHRAQLIAVAPDGAIPDPPPNLLVADYVPQIELLAHLDAVVSHAGHNTVCESLAHGVPLVVAPIRDDQPVIARQVVDAGAGIRVHFGRVGATELRNAITTVLDDLSYRAAARRVQTSFAAAGGAAAAADHLEKLT